MRDLKFLVDGDDVLLKTGKVKELWIREHLTDSDLLDRSRTIDSIVPEECNKTALVPIIGVANYDRMAAYVYSAEGTSRIQQVNGALEAVRELAKIGSIYVVSARKPEQTENTRVWLNEHGFYQYLKGVFAVDGVEYKGTKEVAGSKKAGIALRLGARMLVDDDSRHMPKEPVEGLDCMLFVDREDKFLPELQRTVMSYIVVANWNKVMAYARMYR